ncbi:alpha/beta fold hydrolase [Gordonia malaquae]|uniref:alpha/beta fold hydrolase n=1 Tax=Gordonia malaquae TaxID=410332 RepID=UPI003BF88F7E
MSNEPGTWPSGLMSTRSGHGEPMLFIHGIGHRRQMWNPVTPGLSSDFEVLTVDLPGFGESPGLPPSESPTVSTLADKVEAELDARGWQTAHLVGNSLGAWICLELARRGRARSVCALMPAGLWRTSRGIATLRNKALFAIWSAGAKIPLSDRIVKNRYVRTLALFGLFGRPWRIPCDEASADARNLRHCDFSRTMSAIDNQSFEGGSSIVVPVTVVIGGRDPLIRRGETDLGKVPPQTKVVVHRHLGHVPTWDDPELVQLIVREAACAG